MTFDILTMTGQKSKSSSSSFYCATRYRSLEFTEYTYISHLKAFIFCVKTKTKYYFRLRLYDDVTNFEDPRQTGNKPGESLIQKDED